MGKRKCGTEGQGADGMEVLTPSSSSKPGAVVWRGDPLLPPVQKGLKVLGLPIRHEVFVQHFLENKSTEQQVLFQRIPWVNDPQAAYLLLLIWGATRANFWLRALRPEELSPTPFGLMRTCGLASDRFSARRTPLLLCAPCPLCLSQKPCWDWPARCECPGGPWSSWADSLRMVRHRHPAIAERMVVGLKSTTLLRVSVGSGTASKQFSTLVWRSHTGRSWPTALHLRRGSRAQSTQGRMATAGHREVGTEVCARGGVACSQRTRVLMRSQHGPVASAPLTALPT